MHDAERAPATLPASPIAAASVGVDREYPARGRTEAAEHRDRVEPLPDEDDHPARHPDAAEEQRDQRDEPEISGEPSERVVEILAGLRLRSEPGPARAELRPEAIARAAEATRSRAAARMPRTRRASRSPAGASPGGRRRDVDPRSERGADADVARRAHDVPLMTKRVSPRASVSPTRAARCREERRIHDDAPAPLAARTRRRRRGPDLAIEGVARLDGGHLHQPRAVVRGRTPCRRSS